MSLHDHAERIPSPPQSQRKVSTMSAQEVARELGTDPMKIKSAILNGTMPIGLVAKADTSTKDRTIIIRRRYELWLEGKLLG